MIHFVKSPILSLIPLALAAAAGLLAAPLKRFVRGSVAQLRDVNARLKDGPAKVLVLGGERSLFDAIRQHRADLEASAIKLGVPARLIHEGVSDLLDAEAAILFPPVPAEATPSPTAPPSASPLETPGNLSSPVLQSVPSQPGA